LKKNFLKVILERSLEIIRKGLGNLFRICIKTRINIIYFDKKILILKFE